MAQSHMPSLHLHRLIASGEFATVVLCTREDELVAVKSYSRACADEGVARRVQSEKVALAATLITRVSRSAARGVAGVGAAWALKSPLWRRRLAAMLTM